ncbi:MAG: galactokinase [Streptosporangiaceae bacterium]
MESAGLPPPVRPQWLADWFTASFGAPPELIWHAPGRVNLIGEHTDYNGGLVLPFALGRGVLAAVASRPGGLLELRSRQVPDEVASVRLDQLRPGAVTGWAGYVAGAAWALRAAGCPLDGASVAVDADLPIGAGLSSSAALTCSVVSCLAALAGAGPSRPEIAALARRAETDFVGMPCGIMDQSAAMLCEAGHALLLDCRSGESAAVPLDPGRHGLELLVIDTGVRHELADGQYAARRGQCERAAELLGVASLRDVPDTAGLAALPDPVLVRRARHVVTENRRVERVAALLRAGRLADCGELLTQSHVSLRDDFEVSWPAADRAVDVALAAGAAGARMTGGGFGGCVIVLLPAERVSAVEAAVSDALAGQAIAPAFLLARPGAGAHAAWPTAIAAGSRRG